MGFPKGCDLHLPILYSDGNLENANSGHFDNFSVPKETYETAETVFEVIQNSSWHLLALLTQHLEFLLWSQWVFVIKADMLQLCDV